MHDANDQKPPGAQPHAGMKVFWWHEWLGVYGRESPSVLWVDAGASEFILPSLTQGTSPDPSDWNEMDGTASDYMYSRELRGTSDYVASSRRKELDRRVEWFIES